jgi:hypothetical protein
MSHPKYRALFPHVRITETATKISLPHGGSRSALTPTGALTGRGADLIIIDDPQGAHEADDQAKSTAVRTWYDRNIYQRLDDKEGGVIILVMQRLAQDDLTAHLLDHGGWELLSLPAIATKDEQFLRVFDDHVVRRKGEALNPVREDLDQLRKAMHQMGAQAFMAQYQQEPCPPGEACERANELTDDPLLPRPPYRKLGKGLFVPAPASSAPMGDLPDPVLWAPQPGGQETFLRDQTTHELLLHGGRGGGKSDALLVSFCHSRSHLTRVPGHS